MEKPRVNYYARRSSRVSYRSHQSRRSMWDVVVIIGIACFFAVILWVASQDAALMVEFLSR